MPGAVERDRLAGEPLAAVGHEERGEMLQLVHLPDPAHRVLARRALLHRLPGVEPRARALDRERPGAIALSRMPYRPHSTASDSVITCKPAFDIAEGTTYGEPVQIHVTRIDTTLPRWPPAIQRLPTDWVTKNVPCRTMLAIASKPAGGEVLGAADEVARGVVDEAGERSAVLPDRLDHGVDRGGVADVHRVRLHRAPVLRNELGRGLVEDRLPSAAQVEIRAQLEVLVGDLAAETGAAAGDEDALALQEIGSEHERNRR